MAAIARDTISTLIPALTYRDVGKAIETLTKTFGFAEKQVYRDDQGSIVHAQLSFGNGMVMLGPVHDGPFNALMAQPDAAGGVTGTIYALVEDVDAHHARSAAAGLEIVMPLRNESYGGREYSVRDPEGQIWTFGTYDPWAA